MMVGRIHGALVMTLTLSALCSWCLPSVNAAVESGEIRALIALLGAPSHAEREHATDALWRIGSPARELLSRAASSDDPEIGLRARGILSDIDHGIRPSWPVALRERVRGYADFTTNQKQALVTQLLGERPGSHGGSNLGHSHSHTRCAVRCQCTACIEAEPANP